jgi:hypothetical protein
MDEVEDEECECECLLWVPWMSRACYKEEVPRPKDREPEGGPT